MTPEESNTIEYYDKRAERWAETHAKRDQEILDQFRELLPKGKIIDIGCGAGRDTPFFLENGYDYLGIDASEKMLEMARKINPNAKFIKMNIQDMDFPKGSFDGFVADASFLHINKKDIKKVLKNVRSIVRPGGIGLILIREGNEERVEQGRFFALYREDEFTKILKDSGFEVLSHARNDAKLGMHIQWIWMVYFVKVK